jgi:hypothetical protein
MHNTPQQNEDFRKAWDATNARWKAQQSPAMTQDQARDIIGNRARWEVQAIARALSLHQWLNTPEENQRLKAARLILRAKT